jgi:hypothetical protein
MNIVPALITLLFGMLSVNFAFAQNEDRESARKHALEAVDKIANYKAVWLRATCEDFLVVVDDCTLHVRGDEMYMEWSHSVGKDAQERDFNHQMLLKELEITGCKLPHMTSFSKGLNYDFSPGSLNLEIAPRTRIKSSNCMIPLEPKNWVYVNHASNLKMGHFGYMLSGEDDETMTAETNLLKNGKWQFLRRFKSNPNRKQYVEVDPNKAWMVTDWRTDGPRGGSFSAHVEWTQQDGKWYPQKGAVTQSDGDKEKLFKQWNIEEISFDATKLRSRFTIDERDVPFATKITTYSDKNEQQKVSERYVGGADGEKEHKLRWNAIVNMQVKMRAEKGK